MNRLQPDPNLPSAVREREVYNRRDPPDSCLSNITFATISAQRQRGHRNSDASSSSQSLSGSESSDGEVSSFKQPMVSGKDPQWNRFRDIVAQRGIEEDPENDEGAIESSDDEDTDDDGESAIDKDDEDADDGVDSNLDDGSPSQESHHFGRVDSLRDLHSRLSMSTLTLNKAPGGLGHAYSQRTLYPSRQSSLPQETLMANSPEDDGGMVMQTSNWPPIAVPPPKSSKTLAHSPGTTRIHMLSTELTESLRRNLLLERQEKSQRANAFLRRRRNAQRMADLTNAGGATGGPPPVLNTSRDENWTVDNTWEYHSKGWYHFIPSILRLYATFLLSRLHSERIGLLTCFTTFLMMSGQGRLAGAMRLGPSMYKGTSRTAVCRGGLAKSDTPLAAVRTILKG